MVITLTNLKGGVGKTTLAVLLAKYIARNKLFSPVVVVDLDPQGGSTSLLSGKRTFDNQPTIFDILAYEEQSIASTEVFQAALYKVENESKLFLIPSSPKLVQFGANGASTDLLRFAVESATFVSEETVILVDTGTMPQLVGMGIAAADDVLVPMTLSKQTMSPTSTTIGMTLRARKRLLGIVPSAIGNAQWENRSIEGYAQKLAGLPILSASRARVYPGIPYSKAMVRGEWIWSKDGVPEKFVPTVDAIYADLFGKSADQKKESNQDTAEVSAPAAESQ